MRYEKSGLLALHTMYISKGLASQVALACVVARWIGLNSVHLQLDDCSLVRWPLFPAIFDRSHVGIDMVLSLSAILVINIGSCGSCLSVYLLSQCQLVGICLVLELVGSCASDSVKQEGVGVFEMLASSSFSKDETSRESSNNP